MHYDIKRIQREMAERFWSPSELARRAGLPVSTVTRLFKGSGSPETVGKLAKVLKLDPKQIVILDEQADLPIPRDSKAEQELIETLKGRRA